MHWQVRSDGYRYAFNGMEKDDEVKGNGNSYTTEFRQYDSRVGRWLSLDPLMSDFPGKSPYMSFDNNPIYFTDPYGLAPQGDWYSTDGTYIGNDGEDDDRVYTIDVPGEGVGEMTQNDLFNLREQAEPDFTTSLGTHLPFVKLLDVKHSELLKMAAVAYGETSGNQLETYAISNAIQNNRNGRTITKTLSGNYSYAVGKERYNSFMSASKSKTGVMKDALAGAINAVSGGEDFSNGATYWDGIDVLSGGSSHYRQQKAAYDNRKGIYDPNGYANEFYVNAQEYACSQFGINGKVYRSIKPLLTVGTHEGALWEVTQVRGASIFYSEIE